MKISKFRKSDAAKLKAGCRFLSTKSDLQLVLKRNRLIEIIHQKYGLHSLPNGSESRT